MKLDLVLSLCMSFGIYSVASQDLPGGGISSPHVTGGRHYWDWVAACSEWGVQSQDRYFCTLDGKIVCREGWSWNMCQGPMCAYLETPATFCSEPRCSAGCDPVQGYCNTPNTCVCKNGYHGDKCTDMMALSSCKHGVSKSAEEHCVCNEGWMGDLCDVPICKDGCCHKNGYCTEPEECLCKLGWTGEDCKQCVPYPGCENGSCDQPWRCSCNQGWVGRFCNQTFGEPWTPTSVSPSSSTTNTFPETAISADT